MKLTKRFAIGLMIICAFFGAILLGMAKTQPTSAAETEETKIISKGDINRDGIVDMKDVILASQYLAGVAILDAEQIEIGDVVTVAGKEEAITLEDLVAICQRIAGENVVFDSCKHNNKESVVTEPTCTEDGYTTYTCLSCGYIWTENPTPALTHSPAEAVEENVVEAGCLTTGSYDSVVYCATCHTELSRETKTIPSKGHTPAEAVEDNRVEATCAKVGSYDLVVKCSVCSLELSRETKKIEKTEHQNVVIDAEVPATCTGIGWTEGSHCGDCDTIITAQEVIPVAPHTEETIPAVEVGCTTSGWTEGKKCSVCNTILEAQTLIPATGHDIKETKTIVTTANCTQEGEEKVTVTCTKCNTVLSENTVAIPMLPHDYQGNEEVPADLEFCKDIKKTCTICNTAFIFEMSGNDNRTRHILSSEIVSATENNCSDVKFTCQTCAHWYYSRTSTQEKTTHAWPETGKTLTAATCVTDGVELYVCKNCSSTKNGTLSATGHHYNEGVEVPATDAYCADTRYDCKDCDYFYYARRGKDSANATELTAHTLTSATVDATCTKDGSTTTSCGNADCGYTKTETITALGHDYKVETIAGTATTCVDTKYTCSRGDSTYYVGYGESHATEPTKHDWQKTTTNAATCYSKGMEVYTCSHCKATKNVEIAQLEHDYNGTGVTVEATDTYCKDTKYTCKHCGKIYYGRRGKDSENATELTKHTLTTTTKAATCTADGETKYTCTNENCGYFKTETIPKTGHDYKTEAVAASETENLCADVKNICQNAGCSDWYYSLSKNQNRTTHAWTLTATNDSTCYSEGLKVYTCSHCKATKEETIAKLSHQYNSTTANATEDYCRDTKNVCSKCNNVYYTGYAGNQETGRTLHVWNGGVVTTAVKCTTNGETTYTCTHSGCGSTKTEPIIATGHNYENGVCLKCGEKLDNYIDLSKYGKLAYTLKTDGTYEVAGIGTWELPNLIVIPDTYNRKAVTSIADHAFYDTTNSTGNTEIKHVKISDSVTSIGAYAFYKCTGLTSVTIGSSVTSIGEYAFDYCNKLTSIEIPDSVTSIGENAFDNCAFSYTTYNNAKYFGNRDNKYFALIEATSNTITTCSINAKTKVIADDAFYACNSLTSVTIPNSVTSIGAYAFYACDSLASVTIPNSVTSIGAYAFRQCEGLTNIEVPDSVISIGPYAFSLCGSLTSVTIGKGVTSIGDQAFGACSKISGVYITDLAAWCRISFGGATANPFGSASTRNFYINNIRVTDIVIPDSVTSIKDYAFYQCVYLKSVTIPNSVTSIGNFAFYQCALKSLTIPDSVTSIGESAFYGNDLTGNLMIPDSVTSISASAFSYNRSLKSVTIGSGVTSIKTEAFYQCSNLAEVFYKGTLEQWNDITIEGNNGYIVDRTRYYYSETQPTTSGYYWHFDENGNPVAW